jgi:signal transduction histidine kinase
LGLEAAQQPVSWASWISIFSVIILGWLMALVLRRQEQLVATLRGLRAEAEQRSQELETVLSVSRSVASTLEMAPLLETVLDALRTAVDYSGAAILTFDESGEHLRFAHWRGPNAFTAEGAGPVRYRIADFQADWDTLCRDEPILIPDVCAETATARRFRQMVGEANLDSADAFIHSAIWVPLAVRGQITGLLSITSPRPNAYGLRDASLALGIARQAAVAMENARLHQRVREAAILEERQRLARELHDSVTQALYGVSLYAEAAGRALADGDVAPAADSLREIRETTQEALGEMRLLLFELRPPLLEAEGLAAALRSRLQAVEARAGLATDFQRQGEARLPAETEQALYRLAQEALNNVLKHAHAQHVTVRLDVSINSARLEIADDGIGFEPDLQGGGGFGLRGMRERTERLGATLRLESAPGAGTRIQVVVPR